MHTVMCICHSMHSFQCSPDILIDKYLKNLFTVTFTICDLQFCVFHESIKSCIHHSSTIQNCSITLRKWSPFHNLQPLTTTNLFSVHIVSNFLKCHIDRVIPYVNNFHLVFFYLSKHIANSSIFLCESSSFLFISEQHYIVGTYHNLSIHLLKVIQVVSSFG